MIPNSFIEHAASAQSISLRTGCMCNPGAVAALLGLQSLMKSLSDHPAENLDHEHFEAMTGHELGVVRISLGLVSDFADVQRVIRFAEKIVDERAFKEMWEGWLKRRES
jgi:molybdenum cofactor sulfurtransferase